MFIKLLENIGERVILFLVGLYEFVFFSITCIFRIFLFSSYTKSSIAFLNEQIYISCVKKLFSFFFVSLLFGSTAIVAIISMSMNFSFSENLGNLLTLIIVNELAPLVTVIFFILSYSLGSNERIHSLKNDKENLIDEVYIPKIITAIVVVPLLSLLFISIVFLSGFIVSSLYLKIDFEIYKVLILSSLALKNILLLMLKSLVFAFIAIGIPIYLAHKTQKIKEQYTRFIIRMLTLVLSIIALFELLSIIIFY